jgi:uncharacterized protein (TIGR03437 family)
MNPMAKKVLFVTRNRPHIRSKSLMTQSFLRIFTAAGLATLAVSAPAAAQSFSFTGNGGNGNHSANAAGTGTFAGGLASVLVTGAAADDNCNSFIQLSFKVTASNTADTLTFFFTEPLPTDLGPTTPSFTSTNPVTVTAGTGIYGNKAGTGTGTLFITLTSASTFSFTMNGSVVLTTGAPVPFATITPRGIVPVSSNFTTIQPGSWISIYGNNLANGVTLWNGTFPTSLGNVTVSINGKPGYLWFVSPGQINLQAPDLPLTVPPGTTVCVPINVTTPNGKISMSVELKAITPSWLVNGQYALGVIPTPNGSGAYAGGTYDLSGPPGQAGGRPVKRGETVQLYGIGFGPTKTPVPAGAPFTPTQLNPTTNIVQVYLNKPGTSIQVPVSFAGVISAGLYQINITPPADMPPGDYAVAALVGPPGSQTNVGTAPDIVDLISVQ